MTQASRPLTFLEDHQATRSLHRGDTGLGVERDQGAKVHYLNFNAFLGQVLGSLQSEVDHSAPCDEGQVGSSTNDFGTTDFVALPFSNVFVHRLSIHFLVNVHAPSG